MNNASLSENLYNAVKEKNVNLVRLFLEKGARITHIDWVSLFLFSQIDLIEHLPVYYLLNQRPAIRVCI